MAHSCLRSLPLALLLAGCRPPAPPAAPTPYASETCPLPASAVGYTIVARAADSSLADQDYLRHVVRAVARAWTPARSSRKRDPREVRTASGDEAPPARWIEPTLFWRGDWSPRPEQRAEVDVAILRDGSWSTPRLVSSGADAAAAASALDAVRRTLASSPPARAMRDSVPHALPAAATRAGADSVVVRLLFGERPRPGERAVARFAVEERPVQVRHTIAPAYPPELLEMRREGETLMQFVIDSAGAIDMETVRVLRTTDAAFTREVLRVLPRYTFTAAQLDCAPVPQLVQIPFMFKIDTLSGTTKRGVSTLTGPLR